VFPLLIINILWFSVDLTALLMSVFNLLIF